MKKFWTSRKFWATLMGLIVITTMYFITVILDGMNSADKVIMFSVCVPANLLLLVAFIGGTVWKDYIKSVHYKPELDDSKER